jgi:hypothetical protein
MTFNAVQKIALALPGVEAATAYGSPAVKIDNDLLACIATNKAAEPNTLVVLISFEDRDAMIEADPTTYYLKPHYVNYPCVLVRLSRIKADAMRDLIKASWKFVTAEQARKKKDRLARARARKRRA